jgi:hypothetical protein
LFGVQVCGPSFLVEIVMLSIAPLQQVKCRLCLCKLEKDNGDDLIRLLCDSCKGRSEARRLGSPAAAELKPQARGSGNSVPARAFTAAEKALIAKVHGYLPAQQLLGILNERLVCDLGEDANRYTMEQLYAEIGGVAGAVPAGGHDRASLRKLLSRAKHSGVLNAITDEVISDFAVIFSLNDRQLLVMKDVVTQAREP